jgi:hypothetical protein
MKSHGNEGEIFLRRPIMADDNTISKDIIKLTRDENRKYLDGKTAKGIYRLILQNQDVMLMFIEKDHPRTTEMWDWYKKQVEAEIARKAEANKWGARFWGVMQGVIQWGLIAFLTVNQVIK